MRSYSDQTEDKRFVDWCLMTYGTATPLDWIRANEGWLRQAFRDNPALPQARQPADRYSEV